VNLMPFKSGYNFRRIVYVFDGYLEMRKRDLSFSSHDAYRSYRQAEQHDQFNTKMETGKNRPEGGY
jgi:hypothetical protein